METPDTGADDVRWALDDLYDDPDALEEDLASLEADATAFAEQYRGRIGELGPEALSEALDTLGALQDRLGRAHAYGVGPAEPPSLLHLRRCRRYALWRSRAAQYV